MRFNLVRKHPDERHKWFAWRPVLIGTDLVWLEFVQPLMRTRYKNRWEYQLTKPRIIETLKKYARTEHDKDVVALFTHRQAVPYEKAGLTSDRFWAEMQYHTLDTGAGYELKTLC